jgi:hypothetical protein
VTTTRTCDLCGLPIGPDDDWVTVTVHDESNWRLPTDTKGRAIIRKDWEPPPRLNLHLDLHRACYIEHVMPRLRVTDNTH